MNTIINFVKSIPFRIANKNTTIGGGLFGVVSAVVIGKLEEMSGCKFSTAFMNVDWIQLVVFIISQVFGALMTDANKKITE